MALTEGLSARDARRIQTRERLLGAAIAEFKRAGMAAADVGAIVAAAGVAHGTFYFHFPTKEHVLFELERREEERIAKTLAQYLRQPRSLAEVLDQAAKSVMGLERRLGQSLFNDFLALHFSQNRPPQEDGDDHPVIVLVAQQIEGARTRGETDPTINPMNCAVFFLLGLYALLITTSDWPGRQGTVDDYLTRALRSMGPALP
ncbi:TetR/AcrR family transcriptional regulator [Mycobacterium sp. OTB74]|uniref:TetR/AcrR family transcriptional regulator n=1 Tax=Mycobacterium sp. OTB74 TaxID=1853452 RepID=UPI00247503C9|nr:TetR/AcrR family transcriptional regulator [Mycobacterium sp. OTB74]MDH6245683.1 AcrR family transcriptional regulator [Mycobacterium sp. OTB74]